MPPPPFDNQSAAIPYSPSTTYPAGTIGKALQDGAVGAPINSPTFTGDPKAPTPAPGDNDTSIATTAFVTAAIAGVAIPDGDKGDITVTGGVWSIDAQAVTLAKLVNAAAQYSVLMRTSAGAGSFQQVTTSAAFLAFAQAASAIAERDLLAAKGANIASAATTDLATATGEFVDVTGTTTITALGTAAAGAVRVLRFTGALTLTHNATSLILPTGANIAVAAGDVATFRSLGSGNWVCVAYQPSSALPVALGGTAATTPKLARVKLTADGYTVLPFAATVNTDCSLNDRFKLTLTGNAAMANPTNVLEGVDYLFVFIQDATGGRNITLGSNFLFPPGLPFSPSAGPNTRTYVTALGTAGGKLDCISAGGLSG